MSKAGENTVWTYSGRSAAPRRYPRRGQGQEEVVFYGIHVCLPVGHGHVVGDVCEGSFQSLPGAQRKRLEPLIVVQLADDVFFCRGSGFFHRRCETVGDRGESPAYLLRLGLGVGTGFVDGLAHGADDGFISRRDGRPPAGTEALKEFA